MRTRYRPERDGPVSEIERVRCSSNEDRDKPLKNEQVRMPAGSLRCGKPAVSDRRAGGALIWGLQCAGTRAAHGLHGHRFQTLCGRQSPSSTKWRPSI